MKLEKIGFSSPEDAQKLKNYRYAETDTWVVLELFHKVMLAYADENIEDLPFGEKDCLLILLNWLVDIPSLRKQALFSARIESSRSLRGITNLTC